MIRALSLPRLKFVQSLALESSSPAKDLWVNSPGSPGDLKLLHPELITRPHTDASDFEPRYTCQSAFWASMSRQNPSHRPSLSSSMTSIFPMHISYSYCMSQFCLAKHFLSKLLCDEDLTQVPIWEDLPHLPHPGTPAGRHHDFLSSLKWLSTIFHFNFHFIITFYHLWVHCKQPLSRCTPAGGPQCRHSLHGASPGNRNWMKGNLLL